MDPRNGVDRTLMRVAEDVAAIKMQSKANTDQISKIEKKLDAIDAKLDDQAVRLVALEQINKVLKWVIGIMLAAIPVLSIIIAWLRG